MWGFFCRMWSCLKSTNLSRFKFSRHTAVILIAILWVGEGPVSQAPEVDSPRPQADLLQPRTPGPDGHHPAGAHFRGGKALGNCRGKKTSSCHKNIPTYSLRVSRLGGNPENIKMIKN